MAPAAKKLSKKKVKMTDHVAGINAIKAKFKKLKELRTQLANMKPIYQQHDALMAELMPLFITIEDDKFTIKREYVLGDKKYKLSPQFYDDKKGILVAKAWKSSAFPSISIDS